MERNELSDVHIIQLFSIDKIENGYQVTAIYDEDGGNSGSGTKLIDGTGRSVYAAFENLQRKNSREMTIAHSSYFLISDLVAKDGLEGCLDFISRDETIKSNAAIYILNEDNINHVMTKALDDDFYFHDSLGAITEKMSTNLKQIDNTILSIHNELENESNSLLIPYLVYKDKLLYRNGYATFVDNKLNEYLDYSTSNAIDLFRGNLTVYPMLIDDIGIELTNIKVNTTAKMEKNKLQVHMDFKSDGEIKEVGSLDNIFNEAQLSKLEDKVNQKLYNILFRLVDKSQKDKLDLLDFEELTGVDIPDKQSVLENMDFDFSVRTDIAKNYLLEN